MGLYQGHSNGLLEDLKIGLDNGLGNGLAQGMVDISGANGLCVETIKWLSELPIIPDRIIINAVDVFLKKCVLNGNIYRIDKILLLAQDKKENILTSLISPKQTKATFVNTTTFTPYKGYVGGGTAYINTQWNDASNGIYYNLTTGGQYGYYCRTAEAGNYVDCGSIQSAGRWSWYAGNYGGTLYAIINSTNYYNQASSGAIGHYSIRGTGNAQFAYKNGVFISPSPAGGGQSTNNQNHYIGGRNNAGALDSASPRQYSLWYACSYHLDPILFHQDVKTLLTSIGAYVY